MCFQRDVHRLLFSSYGRMDPCNGSSNLREWKRTPNFFYLSPQKLGKCWAREASSVHRFTSFPLLSLIYTIFCMGRKSYPLEDYRHSIWQLPFVWTSCFLSSCGLLRSTLTKLRSALCSTRWLWSLSSTAMHILVAGDVSTIFYF